MGTGCRPGHLGPDEVLTLATCPCAVGKGQEGTLRRDHSEGLAWGGLPGARRHFLALPSALAAVYLRVLSHTSCRLIPLGPGDRGKAAWGCHGPILPPLCGCSSSPTPPPSAIRWGHRRGLACQSLPSAQPVLWHQWVRAWDWGWPEGRGVARGQGELARSLPVVPALHRATAEPHRGRSQGAREGRGRGGRLLGARGPPGDRSVQGEGRKGHAQLDLHPAGRQSLTVPGREGVRGEGSR